MAMETATKNEAIYFETEDSSLAATARLYDRAIEPFKKPTGRVSFKISGDSASLLNIISKNEQIGIQDMIRAYKEVRNLIYLCKNINQRGL